MCLPSAPLRLSKVEQKINNHEIEKQLSSIDCKAKMPGMCIVAIIRGGQFQGNCDFAAQR